MTLGELKSGQTCTVSAVGGDGEGNDAEPSLPNNVRNTFALAGNQNCGKTTLFNALTGSNQHVGNFPGVTVDRKSGAIKGYPQTEVVDLPGIKNVLQLMCDKAKD